MQQILLVYHGNLLKLFTCICHSTWIIFFPQICSKDCAMHLTGERMMRTQSKWLSNVAATALGDWGRMSCDTCAKAQVTVTKWSCHPARMVLSWDTKGLFNWKNANHPCAALRKTINNGTGDKREHIILSLKDVLFFHKSRNSKSRKSNQTNSLNRRTTWLHTLSKGTRKQNFLSWVNQVIFFPKTMSSFSCHTNCPFNSS